MNEPASRQSAFLDPTGAPVASPGSRPAIPGAVTGAFVIFVVAAALPLIGAIITATSSVWDNAVAEAQASGAVISVGTIRAYVIGFAVFFAALYLLFAFKMRSGRNWARVVLTVVAVLALLSSLLFQSSVMVNGHDFAVSSGKTFGGLGGFFALVAIVLMYLPSASAYFKSFKANR